MIRIPKIVLFLLLPYGLWCQQKYPIDKLIYQANLWTTTLSNAEHPIKDIVVKTIEGNVEIQITLFEGSEKYRYSADLKGLYSNSKGEDLNFITERPELIEKKNSPSSNTITYIISNNEANYNIKYLKEDVRLLIETDSTLNDYVEGNFIGIDYKLYCFTEKKNHQKNRPFNKNWYSKHQFTSGVQYVLGGIAMWQAVKGYTQLNDAENIYESYLNNRPVPVPGNEEITQKQYQDFLENAEILRQEAITKNDEGKKRSIVSGSFFLVNALIWWYRLDRKKTYKDKCKMDNSAIQIRPLLDSPSLNGQSTIGLSIQYTFK